MPAHTAEHHVGASVLSNGQLLSAADRYGNFHADRLAKAAAGEERVPELIRHLLQCRVAEVVDMATWLGKVTAHANAYTLPDGTKVRDSTAQAQRRQLLRRDRPVGRASRSVSCPAISGSRKRQGHGAAGSAMQSAAFQRRRHTNDMAELDAVLAEARFQCEWRKHLNLASESAGITASERIEALRLKVQSRTRL
jgi:hypothetical protein